MTLPKIGPLNIPVVEKTFVVPEGVTTLICLTERPVPNNQVQMIVTVVHENGAQPDMITFAMNEAVALAQKLLDATERVQEESKRRKAEEN